MNSQEIVKLFEKVKPIIEQISLLSSEEKIVIMKSIFLNQLSESEKRSELTDLCEQMGINYLG